MKAKDFLAAALVATIATGISFLGAELATRYIDGYPLLALQLPDATTQRQLPVSEKPEDGRRYARSTPLASGVDPAWYDLEPPAKQRIPDPALQEFNEKLGAGRTFERFRYWNRSLLESDGCAVPVLLESADRVFAFDPPSGTKHPRYRFLYNTVSPQLLVTNDYGFRGEPIQLNKDGRTIRIGFLGASTTAGSHGAPFSYPELVGFWLNHWAREKNINIQFEAINAARGGTSSPDIAAIMQEELQLFEPDFVVYYEGSNQFSPASMTSGAKAGERRTGLETATNRKPALLGENLAIARRFHALWQGASEDARGQPARPNYSLNWPQDIDEQSPPLGHANLPLELTTILRDLDSIRASVKSVDGRMVMTSFNWLIRDGMILDPIAHKSIRDYINIGLYPLTYRDLERLAKFQNRTFEKWARTHGVDFIDFAGAYPFDPNLFIDPIHETYPGVRLHAWIMVQKLIPLIEAATANGSLPKPQRQRHDSHPAFPANPHTARFFCDPQIQPLAISSLKPNNPESTVLHKEDGSAEIVTANRPHHYTAEMAIPGKMLEQGKRYRVHVDAQLLAGTVGFGALSANPSRFLGQRNMEQPGAFRTMTFDFVAASTDLRMMLYNGPAPGQSRILVRGIGVQALSPVIHTIGPGVITK